MTGMHSAVAPEWRSTYVVKWEPEGDQPFEEHLALKTIQSYYSSDDCYVNEEWVQDEIRILQSVRHAVTLLTSILLATIAVVATMSCAAA